MRWVITLLMQCGRNLNALHFNIRLALFGAGLCCLHTVAALALLACALIPASTAEQVIDFSMSGTVFLLVGIAVSGFVATHRESCHAQHSVQPDAGVDAASPDCTGLNRAVSGPSSPPPAQPGAQPF